MLQDVFDRNISVYYPPGHEAWRESFFDMPYPYPEIANSTYIASSQDEFDNMTKYYILEKGSIQFIFVYLSGLFLGFLCI